MRLQFRRTTDDSETKSLLTEESSLCRTMLEPHMQRKNAALPNMGTPRLPSARLSVHAQPEFSGAEYMKAASITANDLLVAVSSTGVINALFLIRIALLPLFHHLLNAS